MSYRLYRGTAQNCGTSGTYARDVSAACVLVRKGSRLVLSLFDTIVVHTVSKGRWSAVGINYTHYCHLLTVINSFVA